MSDAFRVGDIVRAVIISLGDQRDYYLTTAGTDNALGVIMGWAADDSGTSGGGGLLAPLDWEHMIDPITGKKEKRKTAKPF
jgi:exosome complex component CSL4